MSVERFDAIHVRMEPTGSLVIHADYEALAASHAALEKRLAEAEDLLLDCGHALMSSDDDEASEVGGRVREFLAPPAPPLAGKGEE